MIACKRGVVPCMIVWRNLWAVSRCLLADKIILVSLNTRVYGQKIELRLYTAVHFVTRHNVSISFHHLTLMGLVIH